MTARRQQLLDLAERVEREEPSVGLDEAIDRAVIGHRKAPTQWSDAPPAPRYTTSLDAAVTLVPSSHTWAVGDNLALRKRATCGRLGRFGQDVSGDATTPAAALTAAALRARAMEAREE